MGKLGLGMQVFGALLGGDPTANQRRQQYEAQKAAYRRATIAMKARRSLGKVQYAKGIDKNLDAASRVLSRNDQEYQQLRASSKWKSYELYRKSTAATGKWAAAGMTGKTAKRLEMLRKAQTGISQANLVHQMTSNTWRLNQSNKDVWAEYKEANRRLYDQSGIGQVDYVRAALPRKPKGPSLLSRLAPVLGVLGNHYVNNYKPSVKPMEAYTHPNKAIGPQFTPYEYEDYESSINFRDSLSLGTGSSLFSGK